MATAVFNTEEIELLDGTTLKLKAMSIKKRRQFMSKFQELGERTEAEEYTPDDAEDDLLKLIPYCVAGQRPEWENVWSKDEAEAEASLDAISEALDNETVYYIIKQVVGIDLKAMDAVVAEAMMKQAQEQAGTN